ncbi:MAG: TRAP transporter small permease [Proteobacteria bacterium]|nr:TRAP transporter small permease [Pseudomonadota bacterium]
MDWIETVAVELSAFSVMLIMLFTSVDVILRKTMNLSFPSLYEFTEEYLMVAVVFLSLSHVYKIGGHVRVTLIVSHFIAPTIMARVNKILVVLFLMFFSIMLIQGFATAAEAWKFKEVSSTVLEYPMAPALFMVPIGAFLVCIRIIQKIITPESE